MFTKLQSIYIIFHESRICLLGVVHHYFWRIFMKDFVKIIIKIFIFCFYIIICRVIVDSFLKLHQNYSQTFLMIGISYIIIFIIFSVSMFILWKFSDKISQIIVGKDNEVNIVIDNSDNLFKILLDLTALVFLIINIPDFFKSILYFLLYRELTDNFNLLLNNTILNLSVSGLTIIICVLIIIRRKKFLEILHNLRNAGTNQKIQK
jgi:hypothetical protein